MNNPKQYGSPICGPQLTQMEGYDFLAELALDLRWSWNHAADELWQELDPALWEQTHNPWLILQTVPGDHLQHQLASPGFREKLDAIIKEKAESDSAPPWFQQNHSGSSLGTVAYFSMEFMLSEALPIYVGGLGNVAGDQLKSASDLGVPVVAVGLLYQQGYFRQIIDDNGDQQAYYPYNDPGQLPIRPLRLPNGEWLRIQIPLKGHTIWLRAWQVQVGRVKLYLLDSNDAANLPIHREITGEIYGGDSEMRIRQEVILGIGGWRLLEAMGIQPDVCHLNEGHAAFAVLERAFSFMEQSGATFEVSLAVTRAGNLFTTHTAVAAGFDRFSPSLLTDYLGAYAEKRLHISHYDLLALGRQNPDDDSEPFNMAYLAINGSGGVNGVSSLHGRVSRHLFEPLFYRWPTEEVPVGHVTNGVHMPSWETAASDQLWTEATGEGRWKGSTETLGQAILSLSDARIWAMRTAARSSLIDYIRERLAGQLVVEGAPREKIDEARESFDPNVLTIGFARRFVAYKRPDLLLHDPERLVRLLTNPTRPLQLVIAGKAPPTDTSASGLIRHWIQFIRQTGTSQHVIFLSDYDMLLAGHMVGGMDVWLNTPQRPWEASGTSGMKVLVNGGVNLSELDGWWVEAYSPEVGWALGDGREHGADPAWDAIEANALFELLEQKVVPSFYDRDTADMPTEWIQRVRTSMAKLTPWFSSNRTVREYTEEYYIPAAAAYQRRAAENGAAGAQIVRWKHAIGSAWPKIHFGELSVKTEDEKYVFEVPVSLGGLDPDAVLVELCAREETQKNRLFRQEMILQPSSGEENGYRRYKAQLPATRPAGDYTPRIIPRHEGVSVPLENTRILWQR